MKKQIKFIYALLIIVIVGGGVVLVLQNKIIESKDATDIVLYQNNEKILATKKYAGIYQYGYEKEGNAGGSIIIYPKTDTEILFNLQLSKGAPNYNSGELTQQLRINEQGRGELLLKNDDYNCHLSFIFSSTEVTISEDILNSNQNCGFGNGVNASGLYQKIKSDIPEYFTDLEGSVFYFKNFKPEDNLDNFLNKFDLIKTESLDFLKIDLPVAGVVKKIGNPESKSEAKEWASDGLIHQTWFYKNLGIELDIISDSLDKNDSSHIYSITIKSPCKYKTIKGIGIGSTRDEVLHVYKNKLVKGNSFSKDSQIISQIIAGSIYGGILFNMTNDVVSSIYMGAMAE